MDVYVYVDYREEKGGEIEFSTQITQMAYSKLLKETIIKEVSQVF